MARPKKPVKMQKSHLTQAEKETKAVEELSVTTGNEQLRKPPSWLVDSVAKKEWKRIIKELEEIEIVGNLDYANLAGYCNAYANYIKVSKTLKDENYCIERHTRTGIIIVKNPLIDVQTNYASEMRKFASLCGMTIDSRLKAAVIKTEKTEDAINQRFGDI